MPADNRPRRITIIKAPYDYYFKDRSAVICFRETGEVLVKAEIADHATNNGYAIEGWGSDSKTRTRKGKSPARPKRATTKADADADVRQDARVGRTDLAADDRAGAGQPLASAAD